jgi:hypothetical protein
MGATSGRGCCLTASVLSRVLCFGVDGVEEDGVDGGIGLPTGEGDALKDRLGGSPCDFVHA